MNALCHRCEERIPVAPGHAKSRDTIVTSHVFDGAPCVHPDRTTTEAERVYNLLADSMWSLP